MKYFTIALLILGLSLYTHEKDPRIDTKLVSGLKFRNIGPAFNPSTIVVDAGENVGGRHVGYGDGLYKTTDGGEN